jgi:hypothetical protein
MASVHPYFASSSDFGARGLIQFSLDVGYVGELYFNWGTNATYLGFPPLNSSQIPTCGYDPQCTRAGMDFSFSSPPQNREKQKNQKQKERRQKSGLEWKGMDGLDWRYIDICFE